jgi:hypothetical protein
MMKLVDAVKMCSSIFSVWLIGDSESTIPKDPSESVA